MSLIRSCIFSIGYFLLTISYGTLSLFAWVLPPLLRHKMIASWTVVVICWLKFSCGVRYEIRGFENIRTTTRPTVILSKHQSTWETLFFQQLFWPASTILKKELLNVPFFGWGLRALDPIGIDRSNPRKALKEAKVQGIKRIAAGLNLILFPEGTRMPPGKKGNYARSGADIASNAKVDILPVALNAAKCWPPNSFMKYPGLITVSVGPKIETANKNSRDIMSEVEAWIENEMQQLPS